MTYYLGIDPGAVGGIAIIGPDGYAAAYRYPGDIQLAMDLLRTICPADGMIKLAAIEQVHSMPGNGSSSSFKFGMNYGAWQGGMAVLQIPYVTVTPHKWQKAMLDAGTGETKKRSLNMARRLFPCVEMPFKKDNGIADALHLARWAKEQDK